MAQKSTSSEAEMAGHLHGAGMTVGKAALGSSGRLGGRCCQLKTLRGQGRNTSQKGTGWPREVPGPWRREEEDENDGKWAEIDTAWPLCEDGGSGGNHFPLGPNMLWLSLLSSALLPSPASCGDVAGISFKMCFQSCSAWDHVEDPWRDQRRHLHDFLECHQPLAV